MKYFIYTFFIERKQQILTFKLKFYTDKRILISIKRKKIRVEDIFRIKSCVNKYLSPLEKLLYLVRDMINMKKNVETIE